MSMLRTSLACAVALGALAGCAPDATLTIHGSAGAPTRAPLGVGESGDPASLSVGLYALYLGPSADCSDLALVQDLGSTAVVADFLADPVLFSASPPDGAYGCVALTISDVLHVTPATSFGSCVARQDYPGDIYREGETDWNDVDGKTVIGHGSDEAPVDDHVTLFLTLDPEGTQKRGWSPHQIIGLAGPLVVPGQSTFTWDAAGSMLSADGACQIEPGRPSFQ